MIPVGDAVFNFHSKHAAEPARTVAPIGIARVEVKDASDFIAQVSAEERQLASDLAAVLARRPAAEYSGDGSLAGRLSSFRDEPENPFDDSERGFAWQSEDEAEPGSADGGHFSQPLVSDEEDLARGIVPNGTASWLKRARREKTMGRLRHSAAVALSLIVFGAIIATTVYLLSGQTIDMIGLISAHAARIF